MSRSRFRNITILLLLIGFGGATLEDTFYCSDEVENHAQEECCVQCITLHSMNFSQISSVFASLSPEISSLVLLNTSLDQAIFPHKIERPPISLHS